MVKTELQTRTKHNLDLSLQRNEPRRVSGTNTRPTVLHWLVREGKLCKVVANHLRFDLNLVEGFTVVDTDDASNHLRHNNHVAEVGPHRLRLLTSRSIFFLFTQMSQEK
jgi:hypothetical protein